MKSLIAPLSLALALVACSADAPDEQLSVDSFLAASQAGVPLAQTLTLDLDGVLTAGVAAPFTVTGAPPNAQVAIVTGAGFGEGPCPPVLGGGCVDVTDVQTVRFITTDASGSGAGTFTVPASKVDEERFVVAVVADGAASTTSNTVRARVGDGSARIRIVHASPDAPAVDVYADGGLLVPGLDYRQSTGFVSVPAGTYQIDIRAAGAPTGSAPVFTIPALPLDGNESYTAVATGFLGSSATDDQFRVLALADDWADPSRDSYQIRIVHASPDAPTVDLDVGNDGSSEIAALDRFAETGAAGIALPSDTTLPLGVAGGAIPFTIPGIPAGTQVTAIAVGELGAARPSEDNAFGVLALIEDGEPVFIGPDPSVYVFHASSNAGTVDLQVGGATIADNLDFGALAGPVQVPPGAYPIDIFDASGTTYVTTWNSPDLQAGQQYLAVATGLVGGSPAFDVIPFADAMPVDSGLAQLQIFHASPDAGEVRAGAAAGNAFIDLTGPVNFGDATGAGDIGVVADTYELAVADSAGQNILLTFGGVPLFDDDRLFVVAYGQLGDSSFGLGVIDTTTTPWSSLFLSPQP